MALVLSRALLLEAELLEQEASLAVLALVTALLSMVREGEE